MRRNGSLAAILNATAIAANFCVCGPPCSPGKTARSMRRARSSSVVMMIAPRGPQSVLCVVQVITSAMPIGLG